MSQKNITDFYNVRLYHETITKIRSFFLSRGFLEVDAQSSQHILAACEDPKTVTPYQMHNGTWPLPQTGQMWLEDVLLRNPELPGVFCLITSYRNEPHPNPTRHLRQFPLFEYEMAGDMETLQNTSAELLEYLGFGPQETYAQGEYNEIAQKYGVKEIEGPEEELIGQDFSHIFFLRHFPFHSFPFFNMKKSGDVAKKIDALVYGMETIGSAERSCNVDEMWQEFHASADGAYAAKLFELFGKERVIKELKEYLAFDFFPRCGGGIGVNRLMRGLVLHKENEKADWNQAPYTTTSSAQQVQL